MAKDSNLKIIPRTEAIKEGLIEDLTKVLDEAKKGKIEGYALIVLGDKIRLYDRFENRLQMIGALHLAASGIVALGEWDDR